ncbi:hypothetical protein [Streptomyces sp. NPDC048191]|uniref:hypothetical protein n=1 Tax=Streptomyces sp. NPDC048191 TaxID=3155484 RepID=UPI0033EDBFE9
MSTGTGPLDTGVFEEAEWPTGEGSGQAERTSIAPRHLAGWLFADLFLVLFVLVLGLLPAHPKDGGPGRPEASHPAAGGKSGGGRKKSEVGGIDPRYHQVAVRLSAGATANAGQRKGLTAADAAKVADAVAREVARSSRGRRIGMLLTFGGAPQFEENARTLAGQTNAALVTRRPGLFCGKNVGTRKFWDGDPFSDHHHSRPDDAVRVEIYYTNSCDKK